MYQSKTNLSTSFDPIFAPFVLYQFQIFEDLGWWEMNTTEWPVLRCHGFGHRWCVKTKGNHERNNDLGSRKATVTLISNYISGTFYVRTKGFCGPKEPFRSVSSLAQEESIINFDWIVTGDQIAWLIVARCSHGWLYCNEFVLVVLIAVLIW